MKRLVPILLALLILCGCSMSKPISDESITTEPTTAEPETPPATTEPPYEKEVLDGGVWVQTDYSKYTPNELTPKYTRLSQEYIPALQPSDDYGAIYPFIGARTVSDSGISTRYGMMDASGCIVADAVYSGIELIYADTQEQTSLMWALSKVVADNDTYPDERTALATLDGSFVSEHLYTSFSAYEEYIFAYIYEDDHTIVHVYDAQGNLCLNSEDLPFHDRLRSYSMFGYGEGLFVVGLDELTHYYFADWDGNLVYGPFSYARPYSDGYAVVEKYDAYYTYLDKDGNEWMDMRFTYAESFDQGYATASDDNSRKQFLLNANDGVVVRVSADGAFWDDSVFSTWTETDDGWEDRIYNAKGELLHEVTDDDSCEFIGSDELMHLWGESKIVNLKTGEECFLGDGEYYVNTFNHVESFDRLPYFCVTYYDDSSGSILFDASLRKISSTTGYFNVAKDRIQGTYYITATNGKTQFFDMNAEPILTLPFANYRIYNGMVFCYDDTASYYYDMEGNLIFCFPYIGIAGD